MRMATRTALLAAFCLALGASPALAGGGGKHAKIKAQAVRIVVKDVTLPDGTTGPAFIGPGGVGAKTLFTAHAGRPVVMTIVNQSTTMHTLTAKALGLNAMVLVGKSVKVTFTPKKAGTVSWDCVPPCGDWVMETDGYMKGYLKVAKK